MQSFRRFFESFFFYVGMYRLWSWLRASVVPRIYFSDLEVSTPEKAQALVRGNLCVAGREFPFPNFRQSMSRALRIYLMGFDWFLPLVHHREEGKSFILDILHLWVGTPVNPVAHLAVTRKRVTNFLLTAHLWAPILRGRVRRKFQRQLDQQVLCLHRCCGAISDPQERLLTTLTLLLSNLVLHPGAGYGSSHIKTTAFMLRSMVMPDGLHVSRDLQQHGEVFLLLAVVREACLVADVAVPIPVQEALDRMAPALRFFFMGDGKLAQFYDNNEVFPVSLEWALRKSGAHGRPSQFLRFSGFMRLSSPKASLLLDCGSSKEGTYVSPGGLAISMGRHRVIVNGGRPFGLGTSTVLAGALHSTPLLENEAAALQQRELRQGEHYVFSSLRGDLLGGTVERMFYVDGNHFDIRGEEIFTGIKRGSRVGIQFLLHPDFVVALGHTGCSAMMRCNKTLATLRSNVTIVRREAFYCGDDGAVRRTVKLILGIVVQEERVSVRWRLYRGS